MFPHKSQSLPLAPRRKRLWRGDNIGIIDFFLCHRVSPTNQCKGGATVGGAFNKEEAPRGRLFFWFVSPTRDLFLVDRLNLFGLFHGLQVF
jgi:hypothetical protein